MEVEYSLVFSFINDFLIKKISYPFPKFFQYIYQLSMKDKVHCVLVLALLISICCAQSPIMTFSTVPNSVLLSASMKYKWIQIVVDPNAGSPRTNFTGILFNRNSTGNKTLIQLSINEIWTILAGTAEQQTCAILYENATHNLYTYKFNQTAGTASQFANITAYYAMQAASQSITEFGVADNCKAIKFNKKVWHYDNSSFSYLQDTMPMGTTGSVILDQPYRTAIIGGTIYEYNATAKSYQFQRNQTFYQNTQIINFDNFQERILIFSTQQNASSGRYSYKVSINQYLNGVLTQINETNGQTALSPIQLVFNEDLTRVGFGGLNSNLRPVIYGAYVNYQQNKVYSIQFPQQMLAMPAVPYIYVSQDYLYLRQLINISSPNTPVSQFVFKFLGAQLLPISSRNVTPPESLGWRRTIIDSQGNMPSLLHMSVDINTNTYAIFQYPITQPDIIPNITNQVDPQVFSFSYPSGISLRQSSTQAKWMYLQMNPTGNSGGPLTTITGQIFSPGSTDNKITIVDAQPGNWTILGGTDQTLDCAVAVDSVTSTVKTFYYNQTSQSGGVFANVTNILIGQGISNPMTTTFDVSDKCLFFGVGNHVYKYNGSIYQNVSLPSGWTLATYDDTYQIAIVNNTIYQFSYGTYSSVYSTNPSTPFYPNKMIFYQPSKILIYSYVQNGSFYPFRVHSLGWNNSNWNNINVSLQGIAVGSSPGFITSPDFQTFGLGGIDVNLNPFVHGRIVNYSSMSSISVAIPIQMLYSNQIPYAKLSNNFMYYRRLPSQINPIFQNHEGFYQIDKRSGILRLISKRNLTSAQQLIWRNTFINQVNGSMIILYQTGDGQNIYLTQRIAGNTNGNGSPAANIITTDTGVLSDGNTIYLCPTGCSSCLSPSKCDSCADGFVLDSTTSSCLRCKGQCKSCVTSDLTTCTDCFKGTYLNSGSCSLCSASCLQCSVLPNNCTSCVAGSVSILGSCISCDDSNCISCFDAATCTICRPGFVVNSTNKCIQCMSTCSNCDPTNILTCFACRNGFELIGTGCKACPMNCDTCLNGTCISCRNGYHTTSSGTCARQCMFPCMSCSDFNPNSCFSCSGQYLLSGTKCIPNSVCNSTNSCQKCAMGFVLFSGKCYPCQAGINCKQCDSLDSTVCISCNTGYFLSRDSICLVCPSSCISCDTYQTCTNCMTGYTLSGNLTSSQCVACELPCSTCAESPKNCLSCVGGYNLKGWKCVTIINVLFNIKFNTNYGTITTTIITQILEDLAQILNLNSTESITLTIAYSSSTVLGGTIAQSSESQASASVNTLNGFSAGSSLGGVPIISSSFSSSQPQQSTQSNNKLEIILGIIIPVIIIAGVIIGYLIYKKRTSKIIQQQTISQDKMNMNGQLPQIKITKSSNKGFEPNQEDTMQNCQDFRNNQENTIQNLEDFESNKENTFQNLQDLELNQEKTIQNSKNLENQVGKSQDK